MKRLGIVVGVLVLMALAFPVLAQGMFADVPTDHWAYQAVNALQQKGILIGYPDGTFGGKRAMTRYEFAMAINRLWDEVQKLQGSGGAGTQGPPGEPGAPGAPGVTPEELAQIRRMAQEFRDELTALGVDVDQLKKDVSALKDRVAAIEKEMERVRVTFEGNMIAQGTMVKRGDALKNPVDIDGRPMANKNSPNNLLNTAPILWDYDLTIKGKVAEHTRATVVINASTYLPAAGSISRVAGIGGMNDTPGIDTTPRLIGQSGSRATEITPWYYYIETGANLSFLGENAITIGRFPLQLTPYTFKLVDTDYYTYLPKTDSGDFPVTGIKTNFTAGPVGVMLFAVQHLREPFVDAPGTAIGTSNALGSRPWDQSAGARLTFDAFGAGKLGLTYIQAGLSNVTFPQLAAGRVLNKAEIYGADFNSKFMDDRLGIYAEWTKSDYKQGGSAVGITDQTTNPGGSAVRASNKNNTAVDAMLTYNLGGLVIGGGYRHIEPNFYAPGYWHRIGPVKNPVNIKGGRGMLGYRFSEALDINASYEDLQEAKTSAMHVKAKRATAGVNYKLYEGSFVLLGYENVQLKQDVGTGGNRTTNEANYFDVGYGHTFSDNLSLRLYYQYVDWKDKIGAGSYKGNVAGTQLTVKF